LKGRIGCSSPTAWHEVVDFGAHGLNPGDDYPDFVIPLAQAVVAGTVERGVAVCGSGVGHRCALTKSRSPSRLVSDHFSAHARRRGRPHEHHLYGRPHIGPYAAWDILEAFLAAEFSQARVTCAAWQSGFPGAGSNQRAWGWNTAQVLKSVQAAVVAIVMAQATHGQRLERES